MGDRMTPIPFGKLMERALEEDRKRGTVFGTRKRYQADRKRYLTIFGEKIETPFGPAAGPNTQLAQNIIAAYVTGCRFFELKTVQILDGEDLPVNKPCILADDECYNCEWSTELYVPQAYAEYVKAWVAIKALSKEWGLGSEDGFVFNISVGYDLAGIKSEKIDTYINDMMEAKDHPVFKACIAWLKAHKEEFTHLTEEDIDRIPSRICRSVTVSTLHGCPPQEIESIASYLLTEKGLHTFVKCNPTLLGYEEARQIMDRMGYDYVAFGEFHFKDDLQFEDAVPMLGRLDALAKENGLEFGVKITNTFPVDVTKKELPSEEMYMSGKSLCALSLSVAHRLSRAFDGKLKISYSGGADYFNIDKIYSLGIWPITVATTLLKPGGYDRDIQIAQKLASQTYDRFKGVDIEGLEKLIAKVKEDPHHVKPVKPLPSRKVEEKVPLLDCFMAPCMEGCPIHQDIPAYVKLTGEGRYKEALEVILKKNPLPFMTGTLCNHRCMGRCSRNLKLALENGKTVEELDGMEFYGEYSVQTDPLGAIKENPISHVSYSYGTQVIILDQEGKIEKAVSAFDVGTPVNIQSVEGQIEGGMVMGIGYGVTEEFKCEDGIPKSRFGTIGFMRADEAPKLDVILCVPEEERKLPYSLGAKGCGELCMIPTAPACALAYYKLDGKFRQTLPLEDTPYRKKKR